MANSVKFTESGRVEVCVQLAGGEAAEAAIRFEVGDTSIGFGPERIASLFESFSQADASMTRRYGGTGLGLAISKQLATMMGARSVRRASPGEGARSGSRSASRRFEDLAAGGSALSARCPAVGSSRRGERIRRRLAHDDP